MPRFGACAGSGGAHAAGNEPAPSSPDLGVGRRFGEPFATTENPQFEPLGPDADARPPLAQSPDGSMFAVRVGASTVRVYSARKIELQKEFGVPTTVIALAWSRTGELAVVGDGGFVQLWNVADRPRLIR